MKFLIRQRWLIAFFLLYVICRSVIAEEPDKTNLTPLQRKQIQIVSQAILKAKRQIELSGESLAIRKQLKQVRAQLDALTLLTGTVTLKLKTDKNSLSSSRKRVKLVATFAEEDKQQVWNQINSKKIQQLGDSLGKLKTLCDKEVDKRESLQSAVGSSPSGLLQHLKTKFLKPQAEQASSANQNTVITSLSSAALTRLSNLQTEINDAIALPDQERLQQLLVLSKRLQISQQPPPPILADNEENGNEISSFSVSTPTLVSRTSHRRKF